MIQKQIRREYVAAVEEKLKQHPLAMYPHYKDHMTPDVSKRWQQSGLPSCIVPEQEGSIKD